MTKNAIAHYRQFDRKVQPVKEHLYGVSSWSGKSASKIDLPSVGQLLGLLHDLGKYSAAFQKYILSAIGMLNPDVDDEYVDFAGLKGKIDHSTAGAQWIWNRFHHYGAQGQLAGRILAICLASHHGGLIDCLRPLKEFLCQFFVPEQHL
jgi:CRISPR-associated endonuclease/helicase Cas3